MAAINKRSPKAGPAAFLCFLAGAMLMLCAFGGSIVWQARRTALFRRGLERYVVSQGVIGEADAETFATETIAYLFGDQADWQPEITVNGQPLAVPDAFVSHMQNVRNGLSAARAVLPLLAALAIALLFGAWRTGRREAFPGRSYTAGALLPLAITLGLGLWGVLNFEGFWGWVHHTFIPDGIFNINEPVMRLFPESLFMDYLPPVGLTFALLAAVILLWPPIVRRLARRTEKKA